MKVVDLIKNTNKTAFSFEVLPPLKGTGIEKLYQAIDTLREFEPQYINITTHRSEYVYKELGNGLFERAIINTISQQFLIFYVADSVEKILNMSCSTCNS